MSVKNPEMLLKLSKNKFYKLTKEQQRILDDFLLQKSVSDSQTLPKKKSVARVKPTPVTVDTSPEDEPVLENAPEVAKGIFGKIIGKLTEEPQVEHHEEVKKTKKKSKKNGK